MLILRLVLSVGAFCCAVVWFRLALAEWRDRRRDGIGGAFVALGMCGVAGLFIGLLWSRFSPIPIPFP